MLRKCEQRFDKDQICARNISRLVGLMWPTRESGDQTTKLARTRPHFPSHFLSLLRALKMKRIPREIYIML